MSRCITKWTLTNELLTELLGSIRITWINFKAAHLDRLWPQNPGSSSSCFNFDPVIRQHEDPAFAQDGCQAQLFFRYQFNKFYLSCNFRVYKENQFCYIGSLSTLKLILVCRYLLPFFWPQVSQCWEQIFTKNPDSIPGPKQVINYRVTSLGSGPELGQSLYIGNLLVFFHLLPKPRT